jgi:hypothetical protein
MMSRCAAWRDGGFDIYLPPPLDVPRPIEIERSWLQVKQLLQQMA